MNLHGSLPTCAKFHYELSLFSQSKQAAININLREKTRDGRGELKTIRKRKGNRLGAGQDPKRERPKGTQNNSTVNHYKFYFLMGIFWFKVERQLLIFHLSNNFLFSVSTGESLFSLRKLHQTYTKSLQQCLRVCFVLQNRILFDLTDLKEKVSKVFFVSLVQTSMQEQRQGIDQNKNDIGRKHSNKRSRFRLTYLLHTKTITIVICLNRSFI